MNSPYERRVKDVLSKDVVSVDVSDTVSDALSLMVENRVSALPVVGSRGVCVGVVSTTDLVSLTRELNDELTRMDTGEPSQQWLIDQISEHDFGRRRVEELMSEVVETVGPETPLADAGRAMLRHRVHRLPVVNGDRRLLGIISTMDVLGAFVEGAPNS